MSFKFEARQAGEHVHVTVRAGVEGQRALCGTLTLRPEEWRELRGIIEEGQPYDPALLVDDTTRPYDQDSSRPVYGVDGRVVGEVGAYDQGDDDDGSHPSESNPWHFNEHGA